MSTEYGITSRGFVTKPLDVLITEQMETARQIFGPDVDLRASSPIRKWLEVVALEMANLWREEAQKYYSQFVTTASYDALDLLADDVGVSRKEGLQATGTVALKSSSVEEIAVSAGVLVETTEGIQYETTTAATIVYGASGDADERAIIGPLDAGTGFGSVNYLTQPYDLNTIEPVLSWAASSNDPTTAATNYIYHPEDTTNYNYAYETNVRFIPKSESVSRAYLVWSDSTRSLTAVHIYDTSASAYEPNIASALNSEHIFRADAEIDDFLLIGSGQKFSKIVFDIEMVATGAITFEIKLSNGDTNPDNWTTVGSSYITDGTTGFTQDGTIIIHLQSETEWDNWTITRPVAATESPQSAYYVRIKITADPDEVTLANSATAISINNGTIPAAAADYYIGVIGNRWGDASAQAIETGADGNVGTGAISVLSESIDDVVACYNQTATTGGVDRETDTSLSYRLTEYPRSFWSSQNISARLNNIEGVRAASVKDSTRYEVIKMSSSLFTPVLTECYQWNNSAAAFTDITTEARSSAANDTVMWDYDGVAWQATDYVLIGCNIKFTRIDIDFSGGTPCAGSSGNTLTVKYSTTSGDPTAWNTLSTNWDDGTDPSTGSMEQGGSLTLNFTDAAWEAWKKDDVTVGGGTPGNYFWIALFLDAAGGTGVDIIADQVNLYNESATLFKEALGSTSDAQVRRVRKWDVGTGAYAGVPTENPNSSSWPNITNDQHFWCDYNDPSTVWLNPGSMNTSGVVTDGLVSLNDLIHVYYLDASVGQNLFYAIILPETSPLSTTLENTIWTELENIAPLGTAFLIDEAIGNTVNISGDLIYNNANYTIAQMNTNIQTDLGSDLFYAISLGDTIYRNQIIGIVMNTDGVIDVSNLTLGILEHGYQGTTLQIIFGAIIYEAGAGDYDTYIEVDIDGDGIYETIASEGVHYDVNAPSGDNGSITWTSPPGGMSASSNWRLYYYSREGNLLVDTDYYGKLGTVTFT